MSFDLEGRTNRAAELISQGMRPWLAAIKAVTGIGITFKPDVDRLSAQVVRELQRRSAASQKAGRSRAKRRQQRELHGHTRARNEHIAPVD